ncbi:MAG: hypothetical protein HZY79_08765 [Rhodoblastus sp.]|nr:MAG: hypothetical protein HZY79_08765 [Rhodoblastus sp.]
MLFEAGGRRRPPGGLGGLAGAFAGAGEKAQRGVLDRAIARQRLLALDDAASDVVGDKARRAGKVAGCAKLQSAVTARLGQAVAALGSAFDEADHIEKQARSSGAAVTAEAMRDAHVEQIGVAGDAAHKRLDRRKQMIQPVAVVDATAGGGVGARGGLAPGAAQGVVERGGGIGRSLRRRRDPWGWTGSSRPSNGTQGRTRI